MSTNRPGPYTLEIDYVIQSLSHTFSVNCDTIGVATPGMIADDVTMKTKDGTGVSLQNAADDIWGALKTQFNTVTLASTFTLWKRNIHNADKQFVSAGGLTTPNGASGTALTLSAQLIMTWRSSNGGIIKFNLLEGVWLGRVDSVPLLSDVGLGIGAINTYVQSPTSVVMALDRGFAVAAGKSNYGQNEKIFTRRNRS